MNAFTLAPPAGFAARPKQPTVLGLVAGLHALAIAAIMVLGAKHEEIRETAALMVSIVAARNDSRPAPPPPTVRPVLRDIVPVLPPLPSIDVATVAVANAPAKSSDPPPLAAPTAPRIADAIPEHVDPPRFDAEYLDNPPPAYPTLSKRLRETGRVMLSVYVEANGVPSRVELQTSSQYERLDQAAIDAVKRWRFLPAKRGEAAVAAWVLVPIHFTLKT